MRLPETNTKKSINWFKFNNYHRIVPFIFVTFGLIFIGISIILREHKYNELIVLFLEHLGVILFVVMTLHLVQEKALHKTFNSIVAETIKDALADALPNSFKNIKRAGVVDIYKNLDPNHLHRELHGLKPNDEIIILSLWMPYLGRVAEAIVDAINNRGCSVKILIHDPEDIGTISKRAESLQSHNYSIERIQHRIIENKDEIISIRRKLRESAYDRFQCYYSREWVSVSIHGYGSEIFMGLYLQEQIATESHIIKLSGSDKTFYKQIYAHFVEIFKKAQINPNDNIFERHKIEL